MAAFTITLGTVTLPAPAPATIVGPLPSHVQGVSENHRVYGHRLNDRDVWLYTVTLKNISQAQYQELAEFHALNGVRETWVYTASDGSTIDDARFVDTALQWTRDLDELWGLQVRFQGGPLVASA